MLAPDNPLLRGHVPEHELASKLDVALAACGADIVQDNGLAETGGLGQTNVIADRVTYLLAIIGL